MYILEFSETCRRQIDADSYKVRNDPGSLIAYIEFFKNGAPISVAPLDAFICMYKVELTKGKST